MKGETLWSYQPYRPFLRDMGQIHICRLAPTENAIHLEWLSVGEAEYEVWISLRDAESYTCCGTTEKTEFDICDLPTDTDFSLYVKAGPKESARRLVRTGERVGTVVNYLHKDDPYYDFSGNFICSPSLIRHPDGYLLSSMDVYGRQTPQNLTFIFRSDDDGQTWHYVTDLYPCFWGKLFLHRGELYMLACSTEYGDLLIGKSTDGGRNFSAPVTLLRGSNGKGGNVGVHKNPQPLISHGGRLWGTLEWGSWGAGYHAPMVMSCDEYADLLDPANWHFTPPVPYDSSWPGVAAGPSSGNIEGTLAVAPNGKLYNIMRYDTTKTEPRYGLVLAYEVNTDDPDAPLTYSHAIALPGNLAKFTIKFDVVSQKYYTIISRITQLEGFSQRKLLSLMVSEDLEHWHLVQDIYNFKHKIIAGFQYTDYEFAGEDIIFLCRVALNNAPNGHDSNYQIFDRIPNFRSLSVESKGGDHETAGK